MSKREAIAYFRTSSATNVGTDKDSLPRQRAAVEACAKQLGLVLVAEFYDAAVSGADPVDARPGFAAMLERIAGNGVRTILVETASRFARDLIVQETGCRKLQELGIELIAADSPSSFVDDTPTAVLIRQILGAVAEFDRTLTVAKLRAARDRKSIEAKAAGSHRRIEGRKAVPDETVALARRLQRKNLRTGKCPSLREISAKLADAGHMSHAPGREPRPYGAESVKRMLARPRSDRSSS